MTQEFHTYWSLDTPVLIKWFMPGPLASSQMGHPTFKIAAAAARSSKVAGTERRFAQEVGGFRWLPYLTPFPLHRKLWWGGGQKE